MSRTDAHAPIDIRLARGDLSAQPWHALPHDACDLPPLAEIARYRRRTTGCQWSFFYTGVGECPCTNCHGGWLTRARNRAERHRDRGAITVALAVWRGGDRSAFDTLIPPSRRR